VGGRGSANIGGCQEENIVALCDVDEDRSGQAAHRLPGAKRFKDFRVMFDQMAGEIDAVLVSTPDHNHFPAAMVAMEAGKHVYVEKPLAHSVWELRTLKKAAHHYNVISQMGNQGHATDGIRYIKEWYEAGVLGEVREVFAWNNHPDFSSQYFSRPDSFPPKEDPIPAGLDWNLWLGPAAERPFSSHYAPLTWRSWYDFGNGILGDWACHTLDGPFWALALGAPSVADCVLTSPGPQGFIREKSIVRYEFPARGEKPPVVLTWHDGGLKPEIRAEWGLDKLDGSGMIMHGTKKSLITGGRPDSPRILMPEAEWTEFRMNLPEKTHERIKGGPWAEWLQAIKGEGPLPGSNFDYSASLSEMVSLGVLAQRMGTRIEWDAANMKVTNKPELNAYIKEPAREGWRYGEDLV
jgi:predicted dehydrogenase